MTDTALRKRPFVIAHRGASHYAPENTIAAMRMAHQLGLKWVEFDVMLARCGEAIIIHDTTINRTTSGKGKVAKFTFEELRKFSAGAWFNKAYSTEQIPSFKQLIKFLTQHQMHASVEIKPFPGQEILTAETTIQELKEFWPDYHHATVLSSFSYESLKAVRELDQRVKIGLALDKWHPGWKTKAEHLACYSIHAHHSMIKSPHDVQKVKELGYELYVYTVNKPKLAKRLFDWGVDAVFSDVPDKIALVSNIY